MSACFSVMSSPGGLGLPVVFFFGNFAILRHFLWSREHSRVQCS